MGGMNHWDSTYREGGCRGGQKDKLNCDTDITDVLANLTGTLKLGQVFGVDPHGGHVSPHVNQLLDESCP